MQELRFVAVSEDGRYAVLAVPGRSARFTLPIDERLRAVALGQTSRLAQYEIEVESPLRPKEIQARIRAGETVEEIADSAGIPVERVRWFEGPVLAERAYIAEQAQASSVRRPGDSTPGPRLGDITAGRLTAVGADPENVRWDARKRGDGNWQVSLTFTSGGRLHVVEWLFDPRRRHVIPTDDNAARMSLPDMEPPLQPSPIPGAATVTQLTPRLRHEPADHGRQEPVRTAQPVAAPFTPAPAHVTPSPQPPPAVTPPAPAPSPAPAAPASPTAPAASPTAPAASPTLPAAPPAVTPAPAASYSASPASAAPQTAASPAATSSAPPAAIANPAQAASAAPPPAPAASATSAEAAASVPATATVPAAAAVPAVGLTPSPPGSNANGTGTSITGQANTSEAIPDTPSASSNGVSSSTAAHTATEGVPVYGTSGTPAAEATMHDGVAAQVADGEGAGSDSSARPAKKSARGRRSSVPSWDEIMLGSSRQND